MKAHVVFYMGWDMRHRYTTSQVKSTQKGVESSDENCLDSCKACNVKHDDDKGTKGAARSKEEV